MFRLKTIASIRANARVGCVAAVFGLAAACAHADLEGRVVGISDGDTLTVLDADRVQHRVRLAGIDAPERGQPFGQRAKEMLSACAYQQHAAVVGSKIDRYGRVVGKVLVQHTDCNLRQVELGMAWHYKAYAREQSAADRTEYSAAEATAREERRGLWKERDPVAPWAHRRSRNQLGP